MLEYVFLYGKPQVTLVDISDAEGIPDCITEAFQKILKNYNDTC